ncbi:hypothetical protein C8R45DRAFT_1081533 [Mycena sanguinolenta]|nr:hypothetical protein C8R45DRAFT_1081533 [Mycena sanguinolenta]
MARMRTSWSDIPPEIAREIAKHNAADAKSLCAMSLVSQTTRLLVIEHIFTAIQFSSVEDFSLWIDMLRRTQKVKFSSSEDSLRRHQGFIGTPLRNYTAEPVISPLASVRSVEWHSVSRPITMMIAHMALFPNVKELSLTRTDFDFDELITLFGACGPLTSLSLQEALTHEPDDFEVATLRQMSIDLSSLKDLAVIDCGCFNANDALLRLIQHFQPRLETLAVEDFLYDTSYAVLGQDRFLDVVEPFLVNLVLESFPAGNRTLPVLESLALWTRPYYPNAIATLTAIMAPNLTRLIFRLVLHTTILIQVSAHFRGGPHSNP